MRMCHGLSHRPKFPRNVGSTFLKRRDSAIHIYQLMSAPDSTSRAPDNAAAAQTNKGTRPGTTERQSLFTTPASVKRIFSIFPLVTYPPNELPLRAPRRRDEHNLYIFTTASDAQSGAPSFNPGCLKWQVRLCPDAAYRLDIIH